ncbi:hypothetical protein NL108_014738 [Boleophthalmus pectinirostris]|nr:hypothetical protein NL108_014738 [Boleophthalmus pectinirostris]
MESWLSLLLSIAAFSLSLSQEDPHRSFSSETLINNVVQDNQTGRIYVGAVNSIYQLSPELVREARTETGPKEDAPTCTPPASACQDTKSMDNHNKLLLVHPSNGSLIVCGSRYRGICSLLNLTNVDQQLYYSDSKGERTYVASIEDNVNVVGVMSTYTRDGQNFPVFLVGKGYGSLDSTKLISTRILQDLREWVVFESIIEASTVQTTPFVPKYLHDFRHAFKEDGFVYFLFSRTLDGTDGKNFTFVSRLCESDPHYYSHTELQLNCGKDNRYNKVRAAYVAAPGKELARSMSESGLYGNVVSWRKVLFMVASSDDNPGESALCMYPLDTINEKLGNIISACYIDSGKISGDPAKDTLERYKCGADFLPSPLASKPKYALKAQSELTKPELLTAVSVAVENEHTIAFIEPYEYSKAFTDPMRERVNKNLFFDLSHSHLYITTEKKITKVPVQECLKQPNCQSCVGLRDPYCGWCVLEGRCTRRSECRRAEEKNGWLWSPRQQCLKIVSFFPPNLSCKKTQTVKINIPSLPVIGHSDRLHCKVKEFQSPGRMSDSGQVSCELPQPSMIPQTLDDQDFVAVAITVFVNDSVELATRDFKFYNCAATVKKAENTPCMACVSSLWGCQWNIRDHTCSDMDDSISGAHIIKHRQGRSFTIGTELMKNVEEDVSYADTFYSFNGFNFSFDKSPETNVLFYVKDKDTGKKMDSTLNVTLYNCAVGRQDCSLCKNADPKYRCVWCPRQKACVFEELCSSVDSHNVECPHPEITDIIPKFGPPEGGISITIRGSNLGIHPDDIVSISVVGEPCVHQKNKYSVSTSVVCEIGPLRPIWGPVEVEVKGGKRGKSSMVFTYQDPIPESVKPSQGLKAGGTLITIFGTNLKTGSASDVQVQIGGVDCFVEGFGREITCRTGEYRADKVPSDLLPVSLKYGKNTVKTIPNAFQFMENPIIQSHHPQSSFVCGGRNIVVTGSGFDLIQNALLKVQGENAMALERYREKNDSMIQFSSPAVNASGGHFTTFIQLDNWVRELKPFEYHPNPTFNNISKKVITEASIIIVTGRGFSRAMTAHEAQAFVGEVRCTVNTLQDDKLFLDAPSTPPRSRSRRQRRDTRPELLELLVRRSYTEGS